MSNTVQRNPTTTAHNYWRGSSWTQSSPYTRAYAGTTSYTYYWPIPFNLSEYNGKIMRSLRLKIKVDDASNTFSSGEYLGAGLALTNNASSDAAGHTDLGNAHTPTISGDTWNEWDISGAWNALKAGTAYIVLYGNEYAMLYTNYDTVAQADRPYIELVYDEPVQVYTGTEWKQSTDIKVYTGTEWKTATGMKVYTGTEWKTAF